MPGPFQPVGHWGDDRTVYTYHRFIPEAPDDADDVLHEQLNPVAIDASRFVALPEPAHVDGHTVIQSSRAQRLQLVTPRIPDGAESRVIEIYYQLIEKVCLWTTLYHSLKHMYIKVPTSSLGIRAGRA
jgi:hypothetical protein